MSKADRKWLADTFCRLVAIDSESGCEREMADALTAELEKLGFEVTEDRAGETFGGNADNLFAVLKGERKLRLLKLEFRRVAHTADAKIAKAQ